VGGRPRLVRALLFDKRRDANWHLALHQDCSIPVRERREMPGFGPWSVKEGVVHTEGPATVLEGMVTVRLHLDPADERNGCLRVVPGSHRRGCLAPGEFETAPGAGEPLIVDAGDAVLMKPLTLHGSERSASSRSRRVLHLEFSFAPLPRPLEWAEPACAGTWSGPAANARR